jgi:hypothetical protein
MQSKRLAVVENGLVRSWEEWAMSLEGERPWRLVMKV